MHRLTLWYARGVPVGYAWVVAQVDLFFFRDPEEAREREEEEAAAAAAAGTPEFAVPDFGAAPALPGIVPQLPDAQWDPAAQPAAADWDPAAAPVAAPPVPAGPVGAEWTAAGESSFVFS